ncbi:MAG: FAD:protein FMN transferase [Clostridiales bacterium]|nr:FAD:protein FMN transferase [Clostridiales bacterium]
MAKQGRKIKIRRIPAAMGILLLIPAAIVILDTSLCPAAGKTQTFSNIDFAMDTVVSETLYTSGEDITGEIGTLLRETEESLLSWTNEDSEISLINAQSGQPIEISSELTGYLTEILEMSRKSDGAIDPTIGNLIRLWDIGGEDQRIPDEEEILAVLADIGYGNVELSGNTVTIKEGCSLDLGAFGKGIGCDRILEYMEDQEEVTGLLVNLGGSSVLTWGNKPDGSLWQIAITDPREEEDGDYLGIVSLDGTEFLSTSGDYEKYFIEDGIRYHHILDPDTGYPAQNGITAVTVVCDSGLAADGLSTACFVLGVEAGTALLEEYGADALFVDEEFNVYLTEGMAKRFTLLQENYSVQSV